MTEEAQRRVLHPDVDDHAAKPSRRERHRRVDLLPRAALVEPRSPALADGEDAKPEARAPRPNVRRLRAVDPEP